MQLIKVAITAFTLITAAVSSKDTLEIGADEFYKHLESGKPALVKFHAEWCGHCKHMKKAYEEVHEHFSSSDKVRIFGIEVEAPGARDLMGKLGVQGFPTLKFFNSKNLDEAIDYKGGRDKTSMIDFVEKQLENVPAQPKAEAKKESSPKAEEAKKEPEDYVVKLNKETFQQVMSDNSKNVLVKFFAPWCGYCKKMIEPYKALASDFRKEDDVIIAEVDCTEEDDLCKEHQIQGFPTLKLFKGKNKSNPENYQGGRDEAQLLEYLNSELGTSRDIGGDYKAGTTIKELDDLIAKVRSDNLPIESVIKHAEELESKKNNDWLATYYIRLLKLFKEDSSALKNEVARLMGLIKNSNVAETQQKKLKVQLKIAEKLASPHDEL